MAAATQSQHQSQHPPHYNVVAVVGGGSLPPMLHTHSIQTMPHGLGLLTTVASLPPKYRSRYLKIQTKCEIPLDLSVKPMSPVAAAPHAPTTEHTDVPMAVNFTEVYTEPNSDTQSQTSDDIVEEICTSLKANSDANSNSTPATSNTINTITTMDAMTAMATTIQTIVPAQDHNKPITPPLTPNKRKFWDSDLETELDFKENDNKAMKTESKTILVENTPVKQPIKTSDTAPKTGKNPLNNHNTGKSNRSHKATRKLKFDEETSSPVSGTIIRPLEDITDGTQQYSNGDIDPKYNIVEITEETKAELAAIKNVIGDYICKLCRIKFEDAFGLAQHRCACIVLLEYRCPECGKQFNCPANLASHRRWHKPRKNATSNATNAITANGAKENHDVKTNTTTTSTTAKKSDNEVESLSYACQECGKKFKRQAYLKKHELTHQKQGTKIRTNSTTNASSAKGNAELSPNSSRSNNTSPINQVTTTTAQQLQSPPNIEVNPTTPSPTPSASATAPQPLYEEVVITETVIHHHHHHNTNSYIGGGEEEAEDQEDTMSDYSSSAASSSSHHYGRLQIVETGLTEEENIAAAALTNLRNCASVIQHTTLAH